MQTVKVSPKYQVVIPESIRREVGIKVGESIQVIPYQNRIELIPIRLMRSMRGFLKGMDTSMPRDKGRT